MAYWAMMSLRHSAVRKVDTVGRIRAAGVGSESMDAGVEVLNCRFSEGLTAKRSRGKNGRKQVRSLRSEWQFFGCARNDNL